MTALGFTTTQWSRVLRVQSEDPAEARRALDELCARYRRPMEAFLRNRGYDATSAQDLTQEFMTHDLVERCVTKQLRREDLRFRTWLLRKLKHRIYKERRKRRAAKRGGNVPHVALPRGDTSLLAATLGRALAPDLLYDREFALTLVEQAYARTEARYRERGHGKRFEVLKEQLPGVRETRGYGGSAEELGMDPAAVRKAAGRLRADLREAIQAEVREIMGPGADVRDEVRHLLRALASGG